MRMSKFLAIPAALAVFVGSGMGQSPASKDKDLDEKGLRAAADAYSEAVTKGDLKAILAQWAEHGEYSNNLGLSLEGKTAIEATYKTWLADHPKAKLQVKVERIRRISKEAAWVEGTIKLETVDGKIARSRFRTLRIREDGEWRIAQSNENLQTGPQLDELDWMKGTWKGKAGDDEAEIVVEPTLGGSFVKMNFVRKSKGVVVLEGVQIVGIDPSGAGLLSWVFESSGAVATGRWEHDGQRWDLDVSGVDTAGLESNSVQVFTPGKGNETMTWQAIERVVGGVPLADTVPLKLTKSK